MLTNNLQKNTNWIFLQIISIGIIILSLFAFLIYALYPKLIIVRKVLLNQLETVCGCTNHLSFTNHPIIFTSLILTGLVLISFIILSIIKIKKIKTSTDKFVKSNLRNKKLDFSPKLKKIINEMGLNNHIIETQNESPIIFTFGFIKPKICVSSGLVKALQKNELKSVLLHEQHHLIVHEPLKLFLVKIISKTLFFVPGIKTLSNKYSVFTELSADQRATNNFQNKIPLARALYKIIKLEEQTVIKNNLAISFFSSTNERINKLVDDKYSPKFKIFTYKFLTNIFLFIVSIISVNLFVFSSIPTISSHDATSCPLMQSDTPNQCKMLLNEPNCLMKYTIEHNSCENI